MEKKRSLIKLLLQFLLERPAGTPVLLLAIGVPLLGVSHALQVGVASSEVVAAGLLENVGHGNLLGRCFLLS